MERARKHEEKEAPTFTIQETYAYTEDYEELPQKLFALDKFYILKKFDGRENELEFQKYLESKQKKVEWWFKNGNSGKDFFSIRYHNTSTNSDALFYPDWIVRLKDGKIAIFDTKKGNTAINTEGRAEALAKKLKQLGKTYVGGIAVFENGVWYYNCSENYAYAPGKLGKNWMLLENLFE